MGVWLWIDDRRPPPNANWWWATTLEQAWACVLGPTPIDVISFDHDLGVPIPGTENPVQYEDTYPIACWYEDRAYTGELTQLPVWFVHSDNPEGRKRIYGAMTSAERYMTKRAQP